MVRTFTGRVMALMTMGMMVAVLFAAQPAKAADFDEALKRMDAIIAEIQALRNEFQQLAVNANASAGVPTVQGVSTSVSGASTPVFTQSLEYGETNADIERIQKLLATDPEVYPYGVASGFFGPKTEEAVKNFQSRFGLDPVGAIGPATTELLELIFRLYPNDGYPDNVLSLDRSIFEVVKVATAQTISATPPTVPTVAGVSTSDAELRSISVELDDDEAQILVLYTNRPGQRIKVDTDDKDDIVDEIREKTDLSKSEIEAVITYTESKKGGDEDDAEEAIEDAEDEIDEAKDAIDDADDDGEDVDYADDTLDDAKDKLDEAEDAFDDEDYEEAEELANEAEELAEDARSRIGDEKGDEKGDKDEIESIEAEVDEDETEVTVEYENDEDYEFTVEEDKVSEIIEEVADELNLDEDEVEDLIEFDFGDIDDIEVFVEEDDDEARVQVNYESGVSRRIFIDKDDEDDMIEEIAEEIDEDEDDVEDLIDFN